MLGFALHIWMMTEKKTLIHFARIRIAIEDADSVADMNVHHTTTKKFFNSFNNDLVMKVLIC